MQAFNYISAGDIGEVSELLASSNGNARLLSGGTDLLVQLRENRRRAHLLIDVKAIPEMTTIEYQAGQSLTIGAAVACAQICRHPDVVQHFPGLVDAFHLIGGTQIQSRASVGGNLCNASPAADSTPILIVHNAVCLIVGSQGHRQLPVAEFCVAPGKSILEPGEFLLAIEVPAPEANFGAAYLRFIPRNEMDIAVVGAGASVTLNTDRTHITSARIALGAVAPTPLFVEEAGSFLENKEITDENIQAAAKIAQAAARPITDLRGTAEFRKHLSAVLARRALDIAIQRARNT